MNESREASVHALVGAYAIDALDDHERTRFEEHLAACDDCQAEVASLRETASVLGGSEDLEPPASVRRAVLAGITPARLHEAGTEQPAPDVPVATIRRRRFRVAAAGVAAAVIAAIGVGAVVVDRASDDAPPIRAGQTLAERVQEAEDAEKVALELGGGTRATVFRSISLGRAVVVTKDMPPPPRGMVYELWLHDREQGFIPAGLMSTTSDQTLVLQGNAARATRVAVTVEPAQGSRVPSSDPIAVFAFDSEQA